MSPLVLDVLISLASVALGWSLRGDIGPCPCDCHDGDDGDGDHLPECPPDPRALIELEVTR